MDITWVDRKLGKIPGREILQGGGRTEIMSQSSVYFKSSSSIQAKNSSTVTRLIVEMATDFVSDSY
jgi:hypothetical protein